MCSAHHEREARIPLIRAGSIRPAYRGTGSFKVLYALSYYLRLILKHSDAEFNKKNHSRSEFRGGGGACCAPSGSATAIPQNDLITPITKYRFR